MLKFLFVIAPDGYQDIEYNDPKTVLEVSGHQVVSASTTKVAYGSLGGKISVNLLLKNAKVEDYDGIAFIGGPGSYIYFNDPVAQKLAQSFYAANKLTCAICAAPSILANAGLLDGKIATCYPGQAENLKAHGAHYTGNPVEQDGILVTASGPPAAKAFGEAICTALNP
ncbi:MAG: ThiJ/PfpI domain-containing protein [Candidatus Peregrinibacteria bacterium GW2011_GWF2_39_17]|nr:MAG: ThiJ/PfpI domain-containing protein [Candidatus Peregrinibacteria bacterium GW2011_GWF2_39_17]HCW32632.1 DJ-1 family protein [Candidatus Peregrinibacteria bacterium]